MRAHKRIDGLETIVRKHFEDHARFETALLENTAMTKTIAENTSELVTLVKGAKGLRSFAVWLTPLILAGAAIIAWIRNH